MRCLGPASLSKSGEVFMERRVVVTGLGVLSCVGNDVETFWNSVVEGKSGISLIKSFDTENFSVKIGGEVRNFNPEDYGISRKETKRMDKFLQYASSASYMALNDSALDLSAEDSYRIGVIIGSGIGGMGTFESQHTALLEQGPSRVSPFFIPMMISNMASGSVSIRFGLKGPNYSIVSACATGCHSIAESYYTIRRGDADVMVTGGTEASVTPIAVAGFANMKATASNFNDCPEKASRPFDLNRSGFVMSEGCGILILEEYGHAVARGAKIYGEIVGCGMTADAYHITCTAPDGSGAAAAMRMAIGHAGITTADVDYINAHGTSTPVGDKAETAGIKSVFGDRAYDLLVSSSKSVFGHNLGAAGALESIVCLLALRDGIVPPTANYETPDPECDLNYVPNVAVKRDIRYAVNNSFGFGGQNAVLVFKKYEN